MNIKYLGVMVLSLTISVNAACSINYRLLDSKAGTYHHRIRTEVSTDENMINRSLYFLSKKDSIDSKYAQLEIFLENQKRANEQLKSHYFLEFSKTCKNIFESTGDSLRKSSVHMLFEAVVKKELKFLQHREKRNKFEMQNQYAKSPDIDVIIERFFKDGTTQPR